MLAALLSRLYDVTEGAIRIDGTDIRELSLPALRQAVATAFEDPTLFSMSVAENLRLGRPDATDAQLAQAIDIAAAQFVYELPFGLDTRIGEQGMSLSGGQRQRLSLARAILAAPKILVLDDTLSALDVHTEAVVEEALRRVLHAVTGIVVAHRASTVLLADQVALLERPGAPSPTSARTPSCSPVCRSTATCWPPTTSSTTVPNAAVRGRTTRTATGWARPIRSRRPPTRPAAEGARALRPRRPNADDRNRHDRWRGRVQDSQDDDLPIDEALPRRREARALLGSLLRPYRATVAAPRARGGGGKRCAPFGSAAGAARHRPRDPADH